MILRRVVLAALLTLIALLPVSGLVSSSAEAQSINWRLRSFDKAVVDVEFYSQNRRHIWPGGSEVYVIRDFEAKSFKLNCVRGEKICYGAWVRGNSKFYWGVGKANANRCTGCCYTCGDTTETPIINLNAR